MAEDPWDPNRRRRREGLFGGGFFPPEIEREFERMQEMMNRTLADAMRGFPDPNKVRQGEPFVYGFSMRMGPDGKPEFQQFGNTQQGQETANAPEGAREPLVDVMKGDKEIAVTVELPGVEKQDINLHVAEDKVTIRVDAPRRYYKQIALPAHVIPKTAKATYKNGILDLTIQRESAEQDSGFKVDVE